MKKLAIIGRGTAGCLSVAQFLKWRNWEIDWYFDEDIKPQAVGEGGQLSFPKILNNCVGFVHSDLSKIDGSIKLGINKIGWGPNSDFYHDFCDSGNLSYHFNATKLQEYIFDYVKNNTRVNIKNLNVSSHDQIDSDFILDCSGKPSNYDDFQISQYIPVNAAYVTQCYWDYPRFNHTLTVARPHGWVFGIPLHNRCSIGYMYNHNISTLEDVKEDVKEVFKQFNLTPSDVTNTFPFNSYYRKENFNGRIAYNGNASFFLEPMEATSIQVMNTVNRSAWKLFAEDSTPEELNDEYFEYLGLIEREIMIHYYAGSRFNTKFWEFAQQRGELAIRSLMKKPAFLDVISRAEKRSKNKEKKFSCISEGSSDIQFATWGMYGWNLHIHHLGVLDRLLELRKEVQSQ
jgi:tryptophan halogenase